MKNSILKTVLLLVLVVFSSCKKDDEVVIEDNKEKPHKEIKMPSDVDNKEDIVNNFKYVESKFYDDNWQEKSKPHKSNLSKVVTMTNAKDIRYANFNIRYVSLENNKVKEKGAALINDYNFRQNYWTYVEKNKFINIQIHILEKSNSGLVVSLMPSLLDEQEFNNTAKVTGDVNYYYLYQTKVRDRYFYVLIKNPTEEKIKRCEERKIEADNKGMFNDNFKRTFCFLNDKWIPCE